MSDVLNPVQIEQAIRACAERIHKGVTIVTNAESEFRQRDREYDAAYARAYLNQDGPVHERKFVAELETAVQRQVRDVAELAFKHAERTARAVEAELRAWQSVGASVRTMYGAQTSSPLRASSPCRPGARCATTNG